MAYYDEKELESFAKLVFEDDEELTHGKLSDRLKSTCITAKIIEFIKTKGIIYETEKNIYKLTANEERR